jgi:hypothetical protein
MQYGNNAHYMSPGTGGMVQHITIIIIMLPIKP